MDKLPDDRSTKDVAHTFAKAIVSAIPVVSGPASVLFDEVFRRPLDKRRENWLNMLAGAIEELQEKVEGFDICKLSENEMFVSTVLHASQIAQRNHQHEKLEALRNATQNTALSISLDENIQLLFLRFIDELTPWHINILDLFDDPPAWLKKHNRNTKILDWGGCSVILEEAFPELKNKREIYDQLTADLQSRGLLNNGSFLHVMMTNSGIFASRTTQIGKQFLHYIRKQI